MSSSPSKEATDLVELFINMFPNMEPGFVSDVVLSQDLKGNKAMITEYLTSMGGVPVDGAGYQINDGEQEDIDEVQNFIMDCNEHQAAVIAGMQRPETFNQSLIDVVRQDVKRAEELLKSSNLHPMSRDGLISLIREGKDVLECVSGIQPGATTSREEIQQRTGADPKEVERLREMLKKEQKANQDLQTQIDHLLIERDTALTARSNAEKLARDQMQQVQQAKAAKAASAAAAAETKAAEKLASAEEEVLRLKNALKLFIGQTKRSMARIRESAGAAKSALEEEKGRMMEDMGSCASTIGKLKQTEMMEKLYKKMERMYREEVALRKQYYNTIQELRGNIRVFARVRPLIGIETAKGQVEQCCDFDPSDPEVVFVKDTRGDKKYTFNKVFGPTCTQADIFQDTLPLIDSVVDGYNVCIFAYGQTGSGKSYTMEGPSIEDIPDKEKWKKLRGVNRRAVDRLYEIIRERADAEESTVYVSVLEIYCEKVRDLLNKDKKAPSSPKDEYKVRSGLHQVGEFEVPGNYVEGLLQIKSSGPDDVTNLLQSAMLNRKEGKTDMNTHSSRSHMILSLVVCTRNIATGAQSFGKLNLIDLAGSERLAKTNATGQTAEEAKNINLSLTCLGKVISDLQSGAKHVNYRDSKLTHLLQDSLGGSSKVLMFANCSPAAANSGETKNTLEMASRAMKCSLGKASKNKVSSK